MSVAFVPRGRPPPTSVQIQKVCLEPRLCGNEMPALVHKMMLPGRKLFHFPRFTC